ncbi:MAG: hypothetical protein QXT69_00160 [Fervidicoccaceae archaeon]
MWFYFGVTFMAMLSLLDMAIFTYIGYTFKVSPIYYSIVAAMWSIVYIFTNKALSALGDRGKNKELMVSGFLSITIALLLFSRNTLGSVTLAYMFHAVAVSSANLSMSTSVYELFDSSSWWRYSTLQRILQNLLRGFTLILISSGILNITLQHILVFSSAVGMLNVLLLPSVGLGLERKLHMIGKEVNELVGFASSRGILASALEGASSIRNGIVGMLGISGSSSSLSRGRVLVSVLLAIATGDFVFTAMPLLIKSSISLSNYWMAQGITGIAVGLSAALISRALRGERKIAIAIVALRGLWLSFAMPLMYREETLIFYLIGMYLLGLAMDASLFNLYSEINSGYGAHSYFISRELGTLTGSLLAGVALAIGIPAAVIIVPLIFTIVAVMQLL